MRFEDDSIESAKTVKQWNVKIISVGFLFKVQTTALLSSSCFFSA